ncbi:TonB-dependent receptor [Parahaliea mediterranea]|uniref:TonB-dependent receptor n=1 Tax=Parahaliea mediterranea TaxID=651086 RepID=UPI000E2F35B4|nr:TonB-dependent receptor [Parahaliea mediterranea]
MTTIKAGSNSRKRLPLAVLSLSALASHGTLAQSLEEVVVTAQKRTESLQDTPISLAVLGTDELENLSIGDIDDIGINIPNFLTTPHPNSATTPRIFIRGVGNFDDQITQDPSVAVYIDGGYVGRNQGMGMEVADIERIEVLRGPQGILYGRNATGGAVNFITVTPELEEWGFSQQFTVGKRDQFRSRTMVNVPVTDNLSVRGYYLHSQQDGFVENLGLGADNYGDEDRSAQRLDVLWRASSAVDVRYSYDRSHIEDSPDFLAPTTLGVPSDRPDQSQAGVQFIKNNDATTSGHQVTVSWALADTLTLRSITSYRDLDSEVFQDYLSGTGRPNTPFNVDATVDQDQFSQEFHLLGEALGNRLSYTLGAYYFTEDGEGETFNNLPGFGVAQYSKADIDNKATAAFGQATFTPQSLDQRLHITAGIRWSKDQREADLIRNTQLLATGTVLPPSEEAGHGDEDFSNVSPTLTVAYDLGDDTSVYAKIAEGYKTGGFNMRASTVRFFEDGFDEEVLVSYELGLKAQWWNNRVRTNLAVFQADYDDIQINTQTDLNDPSKSDILNAGEAEIQGLELDVTAALTSDITLGVNYGYLNARYNSIEDGVGRDVTHDFEFINAPQHSFRANVTYDIAQTAIGTLIAYLNYSWVDDHFITSSTVNGDYIIEAYGLTDARLTLADIPGLPAGNLRVALWGKNLADEEYAYINGPLFGGATAWGEPRTYGIDLTYEF